MADLLANELVDAKYRIEGKLGSGGMGDVYVAKHVSLGHKVAIKVMQEEHARTEVHATRFLREAKASVHLESDHVVRVLDFGKMSSGRPYIVMEYLRGIDLEHLIHKKGRLSEAEALDYFMQALEGVAHAHAHGLVHRDLKPANLFLAERKDGRQIVKVLDFGLAKAGPNEIDALTGTNEVFGSPQYMAPEQLRASKHVDGRADIWSLGITLFQMLTGQSPFHRTNPGEYVVAVLREEPHVAAHFGVELQAGLEDVIRKCLVKDVSDRVPTIAALAQLLEPYVTGTAAERIRRIANALPSIPPIADSTLENTTLPGPDTAAAREQVVAREQKNALTLTGGTTQNVDDLPSKRRRTFVLGASALAILVVGAGVVRFNRSPESTPTQESVEDNVERAPILPALPSLPNPSATTAPSSSPSGAAGAAHSASSAPSASSVRAGTTTRPPKNRAWPKPTPATPDPRDRR